MTVPLPDPPKAGVARRLAAYLLALGATVGFVADEMRLDRATLRSPFQYWQDTLLILPMVKESNATGSHWKTARLGAPGIQELYDFPVVDHLHFAALWLIGRFAHDPVVAYNLYYLMTYPLTTLSAMLVLRRFDLSLAAAACGGVLYAFLPYHYFRGEVHYFLSAYYAVPFALMISLWICQGRLPFFRRLDSGGLRPSLWTRDTLETVVIAIATASAGAYYAYFACAILAAAGLYGWILHTWRAAAAAAAAIAVIGVAGVANHAPTFLYQAEHGRNSAPHTRLAEQVDHFGFKLAHLVLPIDHHRIPALERFKSAYRGRHRIAENENQNASLGAVGSCGLVILMAALFLPVRRSWPLGPLGALAGFAVVLGAIGGLGSLVAFVGSPQVRAYNRVCVYLAFLAIFAACWAVDRLFAHRTGMARPLVFLMIAAFGVFDQTGDARLNSARQLEASAEAYGRDKTYFGEIEKSVPEGMVFTLPHIPYPEPEVATGGMSLYDHARGYLLTDTVRWSHGAMKGREVEQWQQEAASSPPEAMLRRLVYRGFDGLHFDRRGYGLGYKSPESLREFAAIEAAFPPDTPRIEHPDGTQVFFDLRPFRDRLRASLGDAAFEAAARDEAEQIRILWLHGTWQEGPQHLCGKHCEIMILNPASRTRTIRVSMTYRTGNADSSDLRIRGGDLWTERFPIDDKTERRHREIEVPPGRHAIRFDCKPPGSYKPTDARWIAHTIHNFEIVELPGR